MDTKNKGIVATIVAVVLCGCPGLCLCLFGAITAAGKGTFNNQSLSSPVGFVLICLSLIFIVIPIAVGFFMLRKKPEEAAVSSNETLPPTS
jgi:integral membrane sensor domain MASE1